MENSAKLLVTALPDFPVDSARESRSSWSARSFPRDAVRSVSLNSSEDDDVRYRSGGRKRAVSPSKKPGQLRESRKGSDLIGSFGTEPVVRFATTGISECIAPVGENSNGSTGGRLPKPRNERKRIGDARETRGISKRTANILSVIVERFSKAESRKARMCYKKIRIVHT